MTVHAGMHGKACAVDPVIGNPCRLVCLCFARRDFAEKTLCLQYVSYERPALSKAYLKPEGGAQTITFALFCMFDH